MNALARLKATSTLAIAGLMLTSACSAPTASLSTGLSSAASAMGEVRPATPEVPKQSRHALTAPAFKQLVERISEPDAEFFSDNFISNETSYLQPAVALSRRPKGGAYIGVGPEQNFTYIAMTRPDRAYIVDIRRDNLVLHLLYKAAFDEASSRAHFLALLTGRQFDASTSQPTAAKAKAGAKSEVAAADALEQLLVKVEGLNKSNDSMKAAQERLLKRVAGYGFSLNATDMRSFKRAHRAFFDGGLKLRFSLKQNSMRRYPTLRTLLAARSPEGLQAGFLASEASFAFLQKMQRENRIVPVVGDFAGDHALAQLAKQLEKDAMPVRSFYVSNVEQYLMQNGVWWKWQRNITALRSDNESIFIRGYLDQGKVHPRQMKGHRTATTLHHMDAFKTRKQPFGSMWALCVDSMLDDKPVKLADN